MPRVRQMISHRLAQREMKTLINYSAVDVHYESVTCSFKTVKRFDHLPKNQLELLQMMPILLQQRRFRKRDVGPKSKKVKSDEDEVSM